MAACSDEDELVDACGDDGRNCKAESHFKTNRKIAKPIMEKKRRARINASLNELKSLLVEVLQKEGCRHSSKMEKADILEMTVKHLRQLQRHHVHGHNLDTTQVDKYAMGYNECLAKINEYLGSADSSSSNDANLRVALLSHLVSRQRRASDDARLAPPNGIKQETGRMQRESASPLDSAMSRFDSAYQTRSTSSASPPSLSSPLPAEYSVIPPQLYQGYGSFALPAAMRSSSSPSKSSSCALEIGQNPWAKVSLIPKFSNGVTQRPRAAEQDRPPSPPPSVPWRPW